MVRVLSVGMILSGLAAFWVGVGSVGVSAKCGGLSTSLRTIRLSAASVEMTTFFSSRDRDAAAGEEVTL